MPAQLVALSEGPSILLDKPILLLGRHPECDIQIDSRKISRRHCCIAQVGEHLVVRDLGSTNGIRINGVRVLEGRLKPDDELVIGGYRYRVSWDASGGGSEAAGRASATGKGLEAPSRNGRASEDELLEECDEPVPLGDAGVVALPRAAIVEGNRAGTNAAPENGRAHKAEPRPAEERQFSRILPENLELAPTSDADVIDERRRAQGE